MKNRKKIGIIVIFTSIFILNITDHIILSTAWSNGKSGGDCSSYADDPLLFNYDCHFGTHDWIAKSALDALLLKNVSEWSWLNERINIYLVGTEAPDNSGIDILLDGVAVEGFGDTTYHHIYFYENGSILEDDSALRAKWCGDWANIYFSENKYDAAAFYLGAMTHYISDMAVYAHVADNNVPPYNLNFDEYHSTLEGYILTRSNEHEDMHEFFQLQSFSIGKIRPYNAAVSLAWDTYKDSNASETTIRDAVWVHNNFFTGWELTYSQRIQDTSAHQLYYNRIEESINNAIKLSSEAMNYIVGSDYETQEEMSVMDIFLTYILPIGSAIVIIGIVIFIIKSRL